jgi:hypothetical protein
MTGDHGQHGPRAPRPGFLPPAQASDPATTPGPEPVAGPERAAGPEPAFPGNRWALAALLPAAVLLVAPFLPWIQATLELEGLGHTLTQELGAKAGVNTDGTGQLIPVLAALALGMIGWGLLARNPRISALAAVPGLLAVLSCAIFILRLGRFRTEMGEERLLFGAMQVSAAYGWYLALAAGLLLVGLSLVGLVGRRTGRGTGPSAGLSTGLSTGRPDQS